MLSKTQFPRRLAAVGALVGAAAVSLVGCSPGDDGGAVTLSVWGRALDVDEALVAAYQEANPDVHIELTRIPDDQFLSKLGTAMQSGDGPDVVIFDDANSSLLAASGLLEDITDRAKGLDFFDDFFPGQIGYYQDRIYSVPKQGGPSLMYWNKDLFAQAGLDPESPPATFTEVVEAASAIHAIASDVYGISIDGACGGCIAYKLSPIIWASGGDYLTDAGPDQKTTYATDPVVAEVFGLYREMWAAGLAAPADEAQDGTTQPELFLAGKQGIFLAWPEFAKTAADAGIDFGVTSIPGIDGGTASFAGGNNIGLAAGTDQADAGWEFITWLSDLPQQKLMASDFGIVPVRLALLDDAGFVEQYPYVAQAIEAAQDGQLPNSIAYAALALNADSPLLQAFQAIVFDGADPAGALEAADTRSAEIIAQAYDQIGG
ncbi:MAG: extracellular solute-binding protein [Protaetiibacter sp.]